MVIDGKFPLSVAPEGATNGHSELVSPLASGVAQLGFWCVEDLLKANRTEETIVVPIGIQYRYVQPNWGKLDRLLSKLERDCGLPHHRVEPSGADRSLPQVYLDRLLGLGEYFLSAMTQFYQQFYHQQLPASNLDRASPELNFTTRLQNLLDLALGVSEAYFGLKPQGHNLIERCRRLEEAGWTYIYHHDQAAFTALSAVERGLADWIAQEAGLRMLHMRLVESFVAVTGNYVESQLSFERLAETTLILFDAIARIKNHNRTTPRRPNLGWRQARVTIGTPISVTNRWSMYADNRAAAKQAVADLTQDLHRVLAEMASKL